MYIETNTWISNKYSGLESAANASRQYRTSILLDVKALSLKRGCRFGIEPPSSNYIRGSGVYLRPYVIHPVGSPFQIAWKNSDIEAAQQLFSSRQASPTDRVQDGPYDFLANLVLQHLQITEAQLSWCQFILELSSEAHRLVMTSNRVLGVLDVEGNSNTLPGNDIAVKYLRLLSEHSVDFPSEDIPLVFYSEFGEVSRILRNHKVMHLTLDTHETPLFPDRFFESYRQMLRDSEGNALISALERNPRIGYAILFGQTFQSVDPMPSCHASLYAAYRAANGRVQIISPSVHKALRECCARRIGIFIGAGYNLLKPAMVSSRPLTITDHTTVAWPTPVFEFAQMTQTIDVLDLAMKYCDLDINDNWDSYRYFNVPELLDGKIVYRTVIDQRKRFVRSLCSQTFSWELLGEKENSCTPFFAVSLGLKYFCNILVDQSVEQAGRAYDIKSKVPGSWPQDEENGNLTPGEDFDMLWYQVVKSYFRKRCAF